MYLRTGLLRCGRNGRREPSALVFVPLLAVAEHGALAHLVPDDDGQPDGSERQEQLDTRQEYPRVGWNIVLVGPGRR